MAVFFGTAQPQNAERTVKEFQHGRLSAVKVYKDVNGDGKEDLYSVTTFPMCFCSDSHEVTTYDDDGDGLADRTVKRDFSNQGGVKQLKKEETLTIAQKDKYKMSDISTESVFTHNKKIQNTSLEGEPKHYESIDITF